MAASTSGYLASGAAAKVTEVTLSERHHLVHDPNFNGNSGHVDVYVDNQKIFARGLSGLLRYCYFPRTIDGETKQWLFVGSDSAINVLINLDDNVVCESSGQELEKCGIWTWVYPNSSGTILAVVEGDRFAFYDLRSIDVPMVPRIEDAEFLFFTGERYFSPWKWMRINDDDYLEDRYPLDIPIENQVPTRADGWGPNPAPGSGWINDGHFAFVAPNEYRVVFEVQADNEVIIIEKETLFVQIESE